MTPDNLACPGAAHHNRPMSRDAIAINRNRLPPRGRGAIRRWCARFAGCLLATLLPLILHAASGGEGDIRVIAQHPAGHGELALGEPLYLRIAYDSSQGLRFQARVPGAGAHGAMMNPAPLHPAGRGEALAWLALREPAGLDEVDIQVWNADGQALQTLKVPVAVRWVAGATAPRQSPPWVDELNELQQRMTTAPATTHREGGDDILGAVLGLGLPVYVLLQLRVWRRWQGGWRAAGLLPLWGTIPLLAYTLVAFAAGSNLWPMVLIMLSPLAAGYLLVAAMARALWARREGNGRAS